MPRKAAPMRAGASMMYCPNLCRSRTGPGHQTIDRVHAAQIKKRFPDKDSKILIGCSNGKKYSMDALVAMDEEGYTHIVGLRVQDRFLLIYYSRLA